MRAGKNRHYADFQSRASAADGAGGTTTTAWNTFANAWGELADVSGDEAFEASHVEASVRHTFTTRYRTDITTSHRMLFEGKAYNIRAVLPDPRRTEVVIHLESGVAI